MDIKLDGGLNLSDAQAIQPNELAISLNADYRKDGVVRSRDGRLDLYTFTDSSFIESANGNIFSFNIRAYKNGVSLSATLLGLSSIGKMALSNQSNEALFLGEETNQKVENDGTVSKWGIAPPDIAPTLAIGVAGSLTGDYYFKFTYVRKVGSLLVQESNPSPASVVIAATSDKIDVTCTASGDSQVTHIRIYRTLADPAGGDTGEFYYDQEISGTTATSEYVDSFLGTLIEVNNDEPPSGIDCIGGPGQYNRLFAGVNNKLYFSKALKPESWPALYYVEVGTPYDQLLSLQDWGGSVFMFTKETIYSLQGTDPSTFYPNKTLVERGLFSKQAIVKTEKGIIYLSYDGIYLFNGQVEQKISGKVDALFRGDIVNGINPLNKAHIDTCWLAYHNNKLFFGYPDSVNTLPNKVLVFDFDKGKWSIYDYGLTLISAYVDKANSRLLAGDSNTTIHILETGDDDNGDSFTFKIRSKEFSNTESVAPVYIRYDITNEGGDTLYSRIQSRGVTFDTHVITDSENERRRFLGQDQYKRIGIEIEGEVSSRVEVGVLNVS